MSFGKKPKAPKPSAQELAVDLRQRRMLDEEIAETGIKIQGIS